MPSLLQGHPLPDSFDPDAVDAASAEVRARCDWHIAPSVTETITIVGARPWRVQLPTMHVTAVNTLTVGGLAVTVFEWSEDGVLTIPSFYAPATVVANITHGYPTCPFDVRAVVAKLAEGGLTAERSVKSETSGPFSTTYFDPGQAANPYTRLVPYTRPAVA